VSALLDALRSTDHDVREAAARSLGTLGADEAVRPLIRLLASKDVGMRIVVMKALGRIGDTAAILPLREMAERGEFPSLQTTAMASLLKLGDTKTVGQLAARLYVDPNLGARIRNTPTFPKGSSRSFRRWLRGTLLEVGANDAVLILKAAIPAAPFGLRVQLKRLVRQLESRQPPRAASRIARSLISRSSVYIVLIAALVAYAFIKFYVGMWAALAIVIPVAIPICLRFASRTRIRDVERD
jgi:hypothetical protein